MERFVWLITESYNPGSQIAQKTAANFQLQTLSLLTITFQIIRQNYQLTRKVEEDVRK